jgi:hypothetical protein
MHLSSRSASLLDGIYVSDGTHHYLTNANLGIIHDLAVFRTITQYRDLASEDSPHYFRSKRALENTIL